MKDRCNCQHMKTNCLVCCCHKFCQPGWSGSVHMLCGSSQHVSKRSLIKPNFLFYDLGYLLLKKRHWRRPREFLLQVSLWRWYKGDSLWWLLVSVDGVLPRLLAGTALILCCWLFRRVWEERFSSLGEVLLRDKPLRSSKNLGSISCQPCKTNILSHPHIKLPEKPGFFPCVSSTAMSGIWGLDHVHQPQTPSPL